MSASNLNLSAFTDILSPPTSSASQPVLTPNLTDNFTVQPNQTMAARPQACYPPISMVETVFLTIGYVLVFIVSIGGNAVIIHIVYHYRNIKTAFNILIVNMAVADILDSLVACPLTIGYLVVGPRLPYGLLGSALCKLTAFFQDVSISASVLTLTVIALDRYYAIVHVLRRPMGARAVRRAIVAVWLVSAILFSYNLYCWRNFPNFNGEGTYCAMYWAEDNQKLARALYTADALVKLLLHYALPLFIMIIFYTVILLHLWQRKAPGEMTDKHQRRIERQKRKIIKMLVTIVTAFAVCWLPVHINSAMATFNWEAFKCSLPPGVRVFFYLAAHANAPINPCLYLIFNQNFRDGLKNLCKKVHKRNSTLTERTFTTRDVVGGTTATPNSGYQPSSSQLTHPNTSSSCEDVADSRL